MRHKLTNTFSTDQGFAANDCSAEQSRLGKIVADHRDDIEHHLPALRAFALVLVGERARADDLVAHTVVAAWANIHAYDHETRLRVWLFGMLRAVYVAQRPPSGRSASSDDVRLDLTALGVRPVAEPADPRFWRSFSALTTEQREVLILIGPAEFSLDEAASVCRCTPAMLRHRAKLGRRKLAKLMPLERRARNPANAVMGQTPREIADPYLTAGAPGGTHRARLFPPVGTGPSVGARPYGGNFRRGATD